MVTTLDNLWEDNRQNADTQRVMYVLPSGPIWSELIVLLNQQFNYQPVCLIGMKPETGGLSNIDVPWISSEDLKLCNLNEQLKPVDASILLSMCRWEPVIYEMMSRIMVAKYTGSYSDRRWYYHRLIQNCLFLLDKFKPHLIVAASGPHRVYDYVLECLCRTRRIPYIFPHDFPIKEFCCFTDSQYSNFTSISKSINHLKGAQIPTETTMEVVSRIQSQSYDKGRPIMLSATGFFARRKEDTTNITTKNTQWWKIKKYLKVGKSFISGGKVPSVVSIDRTTKFGGYSANPARQYKIHYEHIKTTNRILRVEKWYQSNTSEVELASNYVFFAASYQPERSSVPDGQYFFDGQNVISILENSVPKDWNIYFREHPSTFNRRPIPADHARDVSFYERILAVCPRIKFIDCTLTPFELIDNCKASAALTGTVIWESLVRGKPTLCFGDSWLQSAPGAFKINSLDDAILAITMIRDRYCHPEKKFMEFLACAERNGADLSFYFQSNSRRRYGNDSFYEHTSQDISRMADNIMLVHDQVRGHSRIVLN